MERCPACRARLADSPVCARCGCDFRLARRAEAQAQRLGRRAIRALAEGDRATAATLARDSLAIHRTALGRAILKLAGR